MKRFPVVIGFPIPSGTQRAYRNILYYLRTYGYPFYTVRYDLSPIPFAVREPIISMDRLGTVLGVFFVGYTPLWLLSTLKDRSDEVFEYGFIEGDIITDKPGWKTIADNVKIIAPSRFVADRAKEAGLEVVDIINCGICKDMVRASKPLIDMFTRIKRSKRMVCYIADYQPRKAINELVEAWKRLPQNIRDKHVLYILTAPTAPDFDEPSIFVDRSMFSTTDEYFASLLSVCDVYVHPSMSEGLGLPIMLAQVFGLRPLIVDAPPMNEICIDCTKVRWTRIEKYNHLNEEWIWKHVFDIDELAEKLREHIEIEKDPEYGAKAWEEFSCEKTLYGIEKYLYS